MLTRKVVGFHFGGSEAALSTYRHDLLSTLAYFSYSVDPNTGLFSSLNGWDKTSAIDLAHRGGAKVVLVASNFGADANRKLLSDAGKRSTLIGSLVAQVKARGGDGIMIDFENVPADQVANFTALMTGLASQLRTALPKAELSCALPALPDPAFDIAVLNTTCDYVVPMTYAYAYAGSSAAGPAAPLGGPSLNITSSLKKYREAGLSDANMVLGIPYFGFDWQTTDTSPHARVITGTNGKPVPGVAKSYLQHKGPAQQYGRKFDTDSSTPYYSYTDSGGQAHVAWYDDPASLALKYTFITTEGLGGAAIWNLVQGRDDMDLWQAITNAFSGAAAREEISSTGNADLLDMRGADLVNMAAKHVGEPYLLSTAVPKDNPDWRGPWNCSEFASWCVYQLTGKLYGCEDDEGSPSSAHAFTGYWGRDMASLGTKITIEQAAVTPGAALLRLGAGGTIGHIVISDGQGGTVEAHSRNDGVIRGEVANRRWDTGVLVPWIQYDVPSSAPPLPLPPVVYTVTSPPMSGAPVRRIQIALESAGFNPGPIDGAYGEQTAAACHAFQATHGLVADGETGPKTAALLRVALA